MMLKYLFALFTVAFGTCQCLGDSEPTWEVRVLNAGDSGMAWRYALDGFPFGRIQARLMLSAHSVVDGKVHPTMDFIPTYIADLRFRFKTHGEDRHSLRVELAGLSLDRSALNDDIAWDDGRAAFESAVGAFVRADLSTEDGSLMGPPDVLIPTEAPPIATNLMELLASPVLFGVPLPEQRLGMGARWLVRTSESFMGAEWDAITVSEITGYNDEGDPLVSVYRQLIARDPANSPLRGKTSRGEDIVPKEMFAIETGTITLANWTNGMNRASFERSISLLFEVVREGDVLFAYEHNMRWVVEKGPASELDQ
jgi:hypothetical protein